MITVVCTDRGNHDRWFIATIDPADPTRPRRDQRRVREPLRRRTHRTAPAGHDPAHQGAAVLACTKCGRSPQLSPDRLRQLVDGLTTAGVDVLDVSRLPF